MGGNRNGGGRSTEGNARGAAIVPSEAGSTPGSRATASVEEAQETSIRRGHLVCSAAEGRGVRSRNRGTYSRPRRYAWILLWPATERRSESVRSRDFDTRHGHSRRDFRRLASNRRPLASHRTD